MTPKAAALYRKPFQSRGWRPPVDMVRPTQSTDPLGRVRWRLRGGPKDTPVIFEIFDRNLDRDDIRELVRHIRPSRYGSWHQERDDLIIELRDQGLTWREVQGRLIELEYPEYTLTGVRMAYVREIERRKQNQETS